ncbi:hypothetical protein PAESOLCIP111_01559 [Paenibacillus solanacearum]|uniref:Uncharacterized protein n=1 Tax=Paenibacillus solanacearum TaxID=2048548 RepID=A0A916JYQ0_9BACL|nr:hypothetical protein [Paenibacillus solanacearum]CAG7612666.1 hypothetical protein PAESOLCIP111_01559 [Paenibacillus solanacearum]
MRNRDRTIAYIIFGLIAIGLLSSIFSNPGAYIIPILVFGIIFWLYKYPPNRWRYNRMAAPRSGKGKRRNATFRVIPGSKNDPDDTPKYH